MTYPAQIDHAPKLLIETSVSGWRSPSVSREAERSSRYSPSVPSRSPLAFSIRADLPLPMKLPPGESFPVELIFEPDQVGAYNGWVMITVEAKDGTRELSRRLIGQGCDPQYAAGDCN